jgi:predicted adenylyl cyclase CyaB
MDQHRGPARHIERSSERRSTYGPIQWLSDRFARVGMARNVEIKARIQDTETMRRMLAEAADGDPETLSQTDTFFQVEVGRLKLREFSDTEAEIIYYRRPDAPGPTESSYERVAISDPRLLRELLAAALGVCGQVSKRRLVYWVGRTRVHLDDVWELGKFLELEVVLGAEEPTDVGVKEAQRLMSLFGIHEDALVSDAYVDLLKEAKRPVQRRNLTSA